MSLPCSNLAGVRRRFPCIRVLVISGEFSGLSVPENTLADAFFAEPRTEPADQPTPAPPHQTPDQTPNPDPRHCHPERSEGPASPFTPGSPLKPR